MGRSKSGRELGDADLGFVALGDRDLIDDVLDRADDIGVSGIGGSMSLSSISSPVIGACGDAGGGGGCGVDVLDSCGLGSGGRASPGPPRFGTRGCCLLTCRVSDSSASKNCTNEVRRHASGSLSLWNISLSLILVVPGIRQ